MTKQNNILEPNLGRTPQGTFAKGNKLQPVNGYQRYADRLRLLQEMYTSTEIVTIARDKKKLGKLPVRDAQIIVQMAKTIQWPNDLTNADVRAEREAMLDRLEGKPKGDIESSGGDTFNLIINLA